MLISEALYKGFQACFSLHSFLQCRISTLSSFIYSC